MPIAERQRRTLHFMETKNTPAVWPAATDALREEIQETAWLLRLLDRQMEALLRREVDTLEQVRAEVQAQLQVAARAKQTREVAFEKLASSLQLGPQAPFHGIMEALPAALHPLFRALEEEAKRLRQRITRRAAQVQRLARRARNGTEELVRMAEGSAARPQVYTSKNHSQPAGVKPGRMIATAV